jgi:hypothetical protein
MQASVADVRAWVGTGLNWGPWTILVADDIPNAPSVQDPILVFGYNPPNGGADEGWPFLAFLEKWQHRLSELYIRAVGFECASEKIDGADLDELDAWIAQTRTLADRVTFADYAPAMRTVADEVERCIEWTTRRFKAPARDARGLAWLHFDADLWAVENLRHAFKEARLKWPRKMLFAPLLDLANRDPRNEVTMSQDALELRAYKLQFEIKEGEADSLMIDILTNVRSTPLVELSVSKYLGGLPNPAIIPGATTLRS